MDIGGTIKKIRIGKNISQEKLAEKILSRPHLSLIESNKSDLSLGLLLKLVEKLHIPVDEFFYLADNYSISEPKILSTKLMNAANKADYEGLQTIHAVSLNKYQELGNYEFYYISLLAEIYAKFLDNNFTINAEIQKIADPIKQYLFSLSDWYLYDLKLFNNTLFVFDTLSVESIADKLLGSLKKYEYYPNAREEYLNILINVSTYFIEKEDYQLSLNYAYKGKQKTKNEYKIYENIILDINIALANIKLGTEPVKNTDLLKNRLFLLESLDFLELKTHYTKLFEKYEIFI